MGGVKRPLRCNGSPAVRLPSLPQMSDASAAAQVDNGRGNLRWAGDLMGTLR